MQFVHRHIKVIAVGLACAAAGAGASAVAVAGASTTPTGTRAAHRGLGPRALVRRTVQGDLVLATRKGFVHVKVARGLVKSVSGNQLTLTEGTRKASYATVQLTLPARTRVRDNRQKATLSAVKPGQRALVVQAPKRALVIAHTPRKG